MSTEGSPKKRVLIVANAIVPEGREAFPSEIRTLMEETSEALIIAPVLTSRVQWLANDMGDAQAKADSRLQEILTDASDVGHPVEGVVGDEDQLLAIADALHEFDADEIVLVLNASSERNRKEERLAKHVKDRFARPVTVCSVAPDGNVTVI